MLKRLIGLRRFKPKAAELESKKLDQWNKFREEYDSLKQERTKLRDEITQLDSKLANRTLTDMERDREFRQRLSKAGEISRRLVQVVGEMARLGKIPDDYQE